MAKPTVPGYEIHEIVGKGAGSKVYRATKNRSGGQVAIKHVTVESIHQRLTDSGDYKPYRHHEKIDYRSFYDQVKLEYGVCQRLARTRVSRFVPEVFSLKSVRRLGLLLRGYNLVMEYVPGQSLREKRDYSVAEITTFYHQAAMVLYAMHSVGWLHCDVKPQHLIVTPKREVKLIDFGQCRRPRDGKVKLQGTPDYMAPEQLEGNIVDERTDIYGLGASFYWVLTGQSNRPAMAMVGASLSSGFSVGYDNRARSVREQNPSVPEALERLILDSCEPDPTNRPTSLREVVERLERVLPN